MSGAERGEGDPSSPSLSRRRIVLGGLAAAAGVGGIAAYLRREKSPVRIATGVVDGTFHALGLALQHALSRPGAGIPSRLLVTGGSVDNLEYLKSGRAELAFVSSAIAAVDGVSLLCPLGEDVGHLVVRRGIGIRTPADLVARAVSVGPERSGTRAVALSVLAHFGLTEGRFRPQSFAPSRALEAFARREVEAVFILGPLRDPTVEALLARGDAELLSLGAPDEVGSALDGLCANVPSLQRAVIPVLAYGGTPQTAVGTIRAATYLLARDDVAPSRVARVTEALFRDKVRLTRVDGSLSRLSEGFDRAAVTYPIHVGADRYFRRDDPSFLERYSDPISLAMSVVAVLWSGMSALRTARQRGRLHRIEDVHREAAALEERAREARTREARRRVYDDADALRTRVFDQLVDERFVADDAFRVLVLRLDALIARNDDNPGMSLAPNPLPAPAPPSNETTPADEA
jgi:TRAP transporter TAXI family solute receptor